MATTPAARPPLQRRSRESLERVLAAGARLVAESGYEGFTIGEVSRRAKVSVGAIYARFESKDALFVAVQDQILEAIEHEQTERFEAVADTYANLREASAGTVAISIALMRDHEAPLRALILHAPADPRVLARGSESSRSHAALFTECLLKHRHEIDHPDPELAADVAFRLVYGTVTHRIAFGPQFETAKATSWKSLTTELQRTCVNYLQQR